MNEYIFNFDILDRRLLIIRANDYKKIVTLSYADLMTLIKFFGRNEK